MPVIDTKIDKIIDTLKAVAKNPKIISRIFSSDEYYYRTGILKNWRQMRGGLPVIDLLDLFPRFEETVNPYSYLRGGAQPIDLALLKLLARRYDSCRYLEFGTWRGESVANIANVAKNCVSIDLPEIEMEKLGFSDIFIKKAYKFFSRNLKNIQHVSSNSHTLDFSTLGRGFDLIFIDGDHSHKGVKMDTENAFKMLKDDNAVIVWHDYKLISESIRWEVFAGILGGCPKDKLQNLYHVSNTLCAIYIKGNFPTRKIMLSEIPYEIPNKSFSIKISARRNNLKDVK